MEQVEDLIADTLAFSGFQFGPRTKSQHFIIEAWKIVALTGCPPEEAVLRALSGEQIMQAYT